MKAVKALLLSGDREKIVFFAGVSRAREVYILAANYLRTLPWQDDADLAKQIATFYQKAKAIDHLVAFYESVARAEIDEFRDYDKGLAALENAIAGVSLRALHAKESDAAAAPVPCDPKLAFCKPCKRPREDDAAEAAA